MTHYARHGKTYESRTFENLRLELRRGCLVLAVWALREQYGYTCVNLSEHGLEIDEGTSTLLRRLETQGLSPASGARRKAKKRFYLLSAKAPGLDQCSRCAA